MWKSVLPSLIGLDQKIQQDDELSHACDNCHLRHIAFGLQMRLERFDWRIAAIVAMCSTRRPLPRLIAPRPEGPSVCLAQAEGLGVIKR
jgi:hypothetical protein